MWRLPAKRDWTQRRQVGALSPARCSQATGSAKWLHHAMICIAGAAKGARGFTLHAQLGQHSPVHDTALQAQSLWRQQPLARGTAVLWVQSPRCLACTCLMDVLCTARLAPAGRGGGSMPLTRSPAGLQALLPC